MRPRRAPRGARGLKQIQQLAFAELFGSRPARGARIEKKKGRNRTTAFTSRPARGAWIETRRILPMPADQCRAPRGARGLKQPGSGNFPDVPRRAPRGARGLKPHSDRAEGLARRV